MPFVLAEERASLTRARPTPSIALVSILAALLIVIPSAAHADAISPPSPCPAGESRTGGGLSGIGGFFGHGGGPPCQPAVCDGFDGVTCPETAVCRRDAHCIEVRTVRELRPAVGHGRMFDPEDPESYHEVERTIDLGVCDAGACPGPARCLAVATCRPRDEPDPAPAADARRMTEAERAWASGVPYDPTMVLGPIDAAPTVVTREPTPAPPTPPAPTPPAPTTPAPTPDLDSPAAPAPSTCLCRATAPREARLAAVSSMLWLAALSVRRARRTPR